VAEFAPNTRPTQGRSYQAPQVLLARYRVLETNTQGGFGSVSICWDTRLERRVAIKCMPLRYSPEVPTQASTLQEALQEARSSAFLNNPNIVTVYDFEVDENYSYLVMEYVDGLSLQELLMRVEDGVLTFDECAHVLRSVARALAFAHENGVLHLDIKPANILIDRAGTVKLGDFGMATLASAAGYGGARGGTVGYMPPEQIDGGIVDERTDIFALSVVVWQSLTGSCPFAAPTAEDSEVLMRKGPSPALSRIEPDLAGIVEDELLLALNPDPKGRPSSVTKFANLVVRELGDAEDGQRSLSDLLNQTDESEELDSATDWERLRIPLSVRYPWLKDLTLRLIAATPAAWCWYKVLPHILPNATTILAFGTAGVALACGLWPPLSGLFGIVALAAGIVCQSTRTSFVLALAIAFVGIFWWVVSGRKSGLSGCALLLPSLINSPYAGTGLAGYALAPGSAFLTGAGSYFTWLIFRSAIDLGFATDALAGVLAGHLRTPATWIFGFACGVGALLCSLASTKQQLSSVIFGQLLALCSILFGAALVAQMENSNIDYILDRPAVAIAVVLGVTLSIAHALASEGANYPEGDDRA